MPDRQEKRRERAGATGWCLTGRVKESARRGDWAVAERRDRWNRGIKRAGATGQCLTYGKEGESAKVGEVDVA